jgi:catalase
VILASAAGAEQLATDATTKDFVSDAFAHCKFIGYAPTASGLLDAAGIDPDDGVIELDATKASVAAFLAQCHSVRFWPREAVVDRT